MSETFSFTQIGRTIIEGNWGPIAESIQDAIKESRDTQALGVLCHISNQLVGIKRSLDLLNDPQARRAAIKRVEQERAETADRQKEYAEFFQAIQRRNKHHIEWARPVILACIAKAFRGKNVRYPEITRKWLEARVAATFRNTERHHYPEIQTVVSGFRGDPSEWDITVLYGVGNVSQKRWSMMFWPKDSSPESVS